MFKWLTGQLEAPTEMLANPAYVVRPGPGPVLQQHISTLPCAVWLHTSQPLQGFVIVAAAECRAGVIMDCWIDRGLAPHCCALLYVRAALVASTQRGLASKAGAVAGCCRPRPKHGSCSRSLAASPGVCVCVGAA